MRPSHCCSLRAIALAVFSLAAISPAGAQTAPVAPAISTPAPTATYKINLSPPFKVGQKYTLVNNTKSDLDVTLTISPPGAPTPQVQQIKQSNVIHLEADCAVLAITAEGQPKKLVLTVKALKASQNGQNIAGLPGAGDVITAESTGKRDKTFSISGQPLNPAVSNLLKTFIPVGRDGTNSQIMYGTKDPVAVGATWVPGPAMLADLQDSMPNVAGIQGGVKLESVAGSGDAQVARISGNFSILGATAPLSPPLNTIPAQCTVLLGGAFPATAKGTFDESLKMIMKLSGSTDAGGAHLKAEGTIIQDGTQTITVP